MLGVFKGSPSRHREYKCLSCTTCLVRSSSYPFRDFLQPFKKSTYNLASVPSSEAQEQQQPRRRHHEELHVIK